MPVFWLICAMVIAVVWREKAWMTASPRTSDIMMLGSPGTGPPPGMPETIIAGRRLLPTVKIHVVRRLVLPRDPFA